MKSSSRSTYPRSASARRSRGGTLLGVFFGLVIGVLISLIAVWLMNKTPLPFRDKVPRVERTANGNGEAAELPGTPKALPGKPGDKAVGKEDEKPRFEFYTILPASQEAAPVRPPEPKTAEVKTAEKSPEGKTGEAKVGDSKATDNKMARSEPQYLQVGAFQKPTDADNLKAQLALLGLDANVQEVEVPEKGRLYRVRAGPFSSLDELNRARGQLSQNDIHIAPSKGK